ncbi:MAG: prepilin-type N-terminal cleavage/methylation domain-containing protein [Clostridia bacterium]|nr:prepilin-type N-terminal cleavage/methylation domain-containing protein [Clostridia bacterium]
MSSTKRYLLNDRGASLVEVLVTLVLSAMLVAAVWSTVGAANASWRSGSAMAAATRESEAALMAVSSKLRVASNVDLSSPSSPAILVRTQTGDYSYAFSLSQTTLEMHTLRPDGTVSTGRVCSDITSLVMSEASADSYDVQLTSSVRGISRTAATRVTIRR